MPTNTGFLPLNNNQLDSSKLKPVAKGFSNTFTLNATSSYTFTIDASNDMLLTGSRVVIKNAIFLDTISINMLDTATGTYTGVNNQIISQPMVNWVIHDLTQLQLDHISPYPIKIPAGVQMQILYTSTGLITAPVISINLFLHQILV